MQATEIKERGVNFREHEVRNALQNGSGQFRRVVKNKSENADGAIARVAYGIDGPCDDGTWGFLTAGDHGFEFVRCPCGVPGDRLWVREGYRVEVFNSERCVAGRYLADNAEFDDVALTDAETAKFVARKHPNRSSPGRFMYRSLSRILLEVTDVRVERVQDISPSDCAAEGVCIPPMQTRKGGTYAEAIKRLESRPQSIKAKEWAGGFDSGHCQLLRVYFSELWDSINAKRGYGWAENPWVWVVAFKVIKGGNTDV